MPETTISKRIDHGWDVWYGNKFVGTIYHCHYGGDIGDLFRGLLTGLPGDRLALVDKDLDEVALMMVERWEGVRGQRPLGELLEAAGKRWAGITLHRYGGRASAANLPEAARKIAFGATVMTGNLERRELWRAKLGGKNPWAYGASAQEALQEAIKAHDERKETP